MLHVSKNTKLGRVIACGLIASALAPAASAAYASSGPTPDVVLSRSDNPPATSSEVTSGPTPDVLLSRSDSSPATSSGVTSGPTPDVVLSRTDNPPAITTTVASDEPGGFDWSSAGIGAAVAGGLIVLMFAGLLGMRTGRRALARS